MFIAGIDPSEFNTGLVVARLSAPTVIIDHATLDWVETLDRLIVSDWKPLTAVVELSPRMRSNAQQASITALFLYELQHQVKPHNLFTISPGAWKPFMKAYWRKHLIPQLLIDQHQKDAFSILLYHSIRLTTLRNHQISAF